MKRDTNQSVPNLSREELDAELDALRQKNADEVRNGAQKSEPRRTFLGRVVGLVAGLAGLFGLTSGCGRPRATCYSQPNDNPDDPEDSKVRATCYEVAPKWKK